LRHPNDNGFAERRTAAAQAKKDLLSKFASAPKPTDPVMQERLAAREAIASARETRRAERDAAKKADNERILAEAKALTEAAEAFTKSRRRRSPPGRSRQSHRTRDRGRGCT
jgi:hypothetical protein